MAATAGQGHRQRDQNDFLEKSFRVSVAAVAAAAAAVEAAAIAAAAIAAAVVITVVIVVGVVVVAVVGAVSDVNVVLKLNCF